jgi:hypothetical protein
MLLSVFLEGFDLLTETIGGCLFEVDRLGMFIRVNALQRPVFC